VKKRLIKFLKTSVKLALVVGLAVGGWYAYTTYNVTEEEDGLGELPTVVAMVRDITVSVQATGVLRPIKVVEIKSKASGEVLDMPVEVGDLVEAGALIAQIDTSILDQELKQVQADYESSVVRLDIAKNQYARAQSLFDQGLISEFELENSQQNHSNAAAQLLRGEATLDLAKERLADATVRAPARGTIIAKTVEEGQIIASSTGSVSGGTTLVQMADLSRLEIRTLVDEVDIGQVRAGLAVESKVEAFADERFDGQVIMIEPQAVVQQSVTTFPVLSRIDNTAGKLLPGMNADVSIVVHRKPAVLTIANEAVRTPSDALEVQRMLGMVSDSDSDAGSRGGSGRDGRGGRGETSGSGDRGAAGDRGGAGERGNSSDRGGPSERSGGADRGASGAARNGTAEQGASTGRGGPGNAGASADRGSAGQAGDAGSRGTGDMATGRRGDRASGSRGEPAGSDADRGSSRGGNAAGSGSGAGDMRARFESASPQERARMMAEFRDAANAPDEDPFGIAGRREDAVVFVYDELGRIATRSIVVGVRDWESTEILAGLDPGDQVLVLPSNSLLRSQDRLRSWAQGRSGIPGIGGGGGPPPGMGRGRGR